jgi:hypothetical protein
VSFAGTVKFSSITPVSCGRAALRKTGEEVGLLPSAHTRFCTTQGFALFGFE